MRVEGFSKISATERPSSAREERGAAFSAAARSQQRGEGRAVELGAGEEVSGHRRAGQLSAGPQVA